MALFRDLSKAQIAFQVQGGEINQFDVVRYRGTEGLCQLYRFEIEMTSNAEVDFSKVTGKSAVLSVNTDTGERWFHGIVSRLEMVGEGSGTWRFRAELVPTVWLLTQRYGSRIFQDKSVKDIITDILTRAGIASDRFQFKLEGTYDPRTYCVQYRETDYNFICRLMEEEGIFWHFEQKQDAHVFVMADSAAAYTPIPGDAKLPFKPPSGLNAEEEQVFRFRVCESVRPDAVVLNDFNFENPKLSLKSQATVQGSAGLEFFDYPGEYIDQGRGKKLSELRLEEFMASIQLVLGQSHSKRLAPGKTFELAEHPAGGLNQSYLITSITHEGKQAARHANTGSNGRSAVLDARVHQSLIAARQNNNPEIRELAQGLLQVAERIQAGDPTAHRALTQWLYHAGQVSSDPASVASALGGNPCDLLTIPNLLSDPHNNPWVHLDFDVPLYVCRFECIPAVTTYRPPRVTPWPVMRGSQTARVVGPQGEEIHTDKYGRVKVQFNWDREGKFDDKSSCWIRVSQGMAGGQYGMLFLPRVGQEVIIDFLEGDPDQPIIVGRVYNADHMPAYTLPDEKTKSYIKTNSSKGGGGTNEIRFEDLKGKEQLLIQAQKRMDTRVKSVHYHTVGGSYHVHVGGEDEESGEIWGELRELIYKKKQVHVKGDLYTWVEKSENRAIDGAQAISVGGTRSLTVAKDVVDTFKANHKHEVTATYACKAANIKLEATGEIELTCGGSSIVLTPGAVFIVGTVVNINSGPGPAVAPVSATGAGAGQAEDAAVAQKTDPGKDTTYSGGEELAAAAAPPEVAGHDFPEDKPPEPPEPPSWIDVELTDEEGDPVPGEKYKVTDSKGKEHEGSLDANGFAHVVVPPGACQVTFPNLDAEAWDRA